MRWWSRSVATLAVAGMVAVCPAFADRSAAADPDLSSVRLRLDDLPAGFREVAIDELVEGAVSSEQVGEAFARAFQDAAVEQYVVYESGDTTDLFEVLVVGPLTDDEVAEMIRGREDHPDEVIDSLVPSFTLGMDLGEPAAIDTARIGDSSVGFTQTVTVSSYAVATNAVGTEFREAQRRLVAGIRGNRMFFVGGLHIGADTPDVDVLAAAGLVDERLAAALGVSVSGAGTYRPAGTFSPEVATHIPTVTEISTDPAVIGANLVFAAIAVIVLGAAMRLLNSTLARHEGALEQVLLPARVVGRWWRAADDAVRRRAGRSGNVLRVLGVLLFYGVLFSFLEPGWNPLTAAGVVVLVVMTLAFGLVGTGDDLSEFGSARRHGLAARLVVKPALVLMAVGSVVLTKVAGLVPGIMIGTPESFTMEGDFEERDEVRLALVGMGTTAAVGLGAWALAAPLDGMVGDDGGGLVAGLVTLLVLVFAVAVENLFANLLGFRGSEGETLRRRSPVGWFVVLLAVTGLFFHTLINPDGDLGESLETTNVRAVLITVGMFCSVTLVIWLAFLGRDEEPAVVPAAHTDLPLPGPAEPPVESTEQPVAPTIEAVAVEPVPVEPVAPTVEAVPTVEPAVEPVAPMAPPHLEQPPDRSLAPEVAAAGWYRDPLGHRDGRYWDGERWTDWVAQGGVMGRDPVEEPEPVSR